MAADQPDDDKQQPTIRRREGHGFAPLPDEGGSYVAPQENSRGPLVLALAIVVLIVFAVVVYNAYKQGVRNAGDDVLAQIASEGAFKKKPAAPGGRMDENVDIEVLHQGQEITDETIRPAPVREEPVPLASDIAQASLEEGASGLESKSPLKSPSAPDPSHSRVVGRSGQPVDLQNMLADLQTSPAPAPTAKAAPAPVREAEIRRAPPEPTPAVKPTPSPSASSTRMAAASSAASSSPAGDYVVQLAAVQDEAAVDGEWAKASKRAPELMLYAQRVIETVDLGAKGVWHRIQAGGFESREAASEFCQSYKTRGGDCIVKAR